MSGQLSQRVHFVKGLDPIADGFAGTVGSDVVNMKGNAGATFVIYKGVGTTGTSTITVEACDNTTPSNTTAIPFHYKAITTGDTEGAYTAATTSGFATTAGSSELYVIEVDAEELGDTGYGYLRLKAVEVVDDPVLGGILIMLHRGRYQQDVPATAIT